MVNKNHLKAFVIHVVSQHTPFPFQRDFLSAVVTNVQNIIQSVSPGELFVYVIVILNT